MLLRNHIKKVTTFSPLIAITQARNLTSSPETSPASNVLLYTALTLIFLMILLYIDKRRNFVWLTTVRHCIGDLILRVRNYRKRNIDKSMRVQTEEVLPTPKTVHHAETENQRPFIESQPSSILSEPLTSPSDPIAQEELQQRKEVNLKDVFQVKEHKGTHKPKKEKKSKSKLKSRLQSTSGTQEEDAVNGQREKQEESSFNQEGSIDDAVNRGTEVE